MNAVDNVFLVGPMGAGKTTIVMLVAGEYALRGKRVLLIDLDYQGSLSSMAFPDDSSWLPPKGADSVATLALSGEIEPSAFLHACKNVADEPRLHVATAHYDVAQADNRLLIEWLLEKRTFKKRSWNRRFSDLLLGRSYYPNEMRYNLAKLLHSDALRENFDVVVIDCPPRLTTGTIQALCASSHLLIPTLLDGPSGESVVSFCEQVEAMKSGGLCPNIEYVGVVASRFAAHQTKWHPAISYVADQLKAKKIDCGFLPASTFIPQTVAIGEQGSGIAYFSIGGTQQAARAKQAFSNLAEHVAAQICVARAPNFDRNLQLVFPAAAE